MGLPPRLDGIGQHDGGSSGHHGMMNAAEDFRVHPCGIRAEDLVQALLVHFSNRLVSSPVSARSSGAEITPFWRAIGTRLEGISILSVDFN